MAGSVEYKYRISYCLKPIYVGQTVKIKWEKNIFCGFEVWQNVK